MMRPLADKRLVGPFIGRDRANTVSKTGSHSSDSTYLYRGADIETVNNEVLNLGQLDGTHIDVLEATPREKYDDVGHRPYIEELTWFEGTPNLPQDFKKVPVTGGVSSNINATRRFRGSKGLLIVLNSSQVPFEMAQYTYEWMNEHPGVLTQILTTMDAELRIPGSGLWGLLDKSVFVNKPDRYVIEHWQPENLPATSPNSPFADEEEWFALESPVQISRAFEGIVSVRTESNIRVASRDSDGSQEENIREYYNQILAELGEFPEPLYMLVFRGRDIPKDGYYPRDRIKFAMDKSGFIDPQDIPQKFLGNKQ